MTLYVVLSIIVFSCPPCPSQVGTPLRQVICSPMEKSSQNTPSRQTKNVLCAIGALTLYFKFNPLCSFVICSLFQRISQPPKWHTNILWHYHSSTFKVNLMDTSSPISLDPLEPSLSQESLFDFLSHLYIQAWLGKTLKVMVLRLL